MMRLMLMLARMLSNEAILTGESGFVVERQKVLQDRTETSQCLCCLENRNEQKIEGRGILTKTH